MQRCAKCLLPESYPGLSLDEHAICNHCHTYQPKQRWGSQSELLYLGHRYQGSNPGGYDCLVALSGGRDSSFTAWYAVKQMGLKALGYTFDNGFMPEETKRNVERVTRVLGMDHVYFRPGDMPRFERHLLRSWQAAPSPATIALLCTGCHSGYQIGLRRVAREHGIKFVISGSGEPQTSFAERLLAHDPREPRRDLSRRNLLRGFAREMIHNPRFVLQPRCVQALVNEFSYRYALRAKPAFQEAPIFRYLDWNETLIMDTITRELGWQAGAHTTTSWRSDCQIHTIRQYLYRELLGFTKNDDMLACLIREDRISQEEARRRLERENVVAEDYLSEVLAGQGVAFADFKAAVARYKTRHPLPEEAPAMTPALQG